MLRSVVKLSPHRLGISSNILFSGRPLVQRSALLTRNTARDSFLPQQQHLKIRPTWRALSSQSKEDGSSKKTKAKEGEDPGSELVMTPGEQVVAVSRLGMWAGIFGFACACAYYIGKELLPTKMSPNTVFNGATALIRDSAHVKRQYGETLKFYGKDHGGHREGRRNFIEHTEYVSPDDGSKRTRVRFNLEGQFHNAHCFVEVSNQMSSGEYVYILVQDKRSGRVITVQDNRAALTSKRLAGGNSETASAMQQLLGGNNK